jgi:hypothetical protein
MFRVVIPKQVHLDVWFLMSSGYGSSLLARYSTWPAAARLVHFSKWKLAKIIGGGRSPPTPPPPPIFRHWIQVYEYHQDAFQGRIFIFFKGVETFLVRCKRHHWASFNRGWALELKTFTQNRRGEAKYWWGWTLHKRVRETLGPPQ